MSNLESHVTFKIHLFVLYIFKLKFISHILDCDNCLELSPYECLYMNNTCYRIHDNVRNWFTARWLCIQDGGILAQLLSGNLRKAISLHIKKYKTQSRPNKYFVGFRSSDWYIVSKSAGILANFS